jgi:long-chain acyl-CoA synthetase
LKKDAHATSDEIIAFCRERIAAYKVPSVVEFLNELPKSATGKILKRVLRTS